ncbi:MAG: ABC transporter permease [Sphingobacteriales bacterium]
METVIPKTSTVLAALLKADFTTLWRNRRAVVMVFLVPLVIIICFKDLVNTIGGPYVLSESIAYGLIAIGLMGYTNSIARDRDKGIFQRLRVAPASNWTIMISRLFVQLTMIIAVTTIVFIVGFDYDKIKLTPNSYILTYFTAIIGGSVYLALGQVIVGLIKNPETVNSTSRLIYFTFVIVGMFGDIGKLGSEVQHMTQWSPYGTVKTIMAAGMVPGSWTMNTTNALLVTLGYTIVFAVIGIKNFKWNTK